MAGQSDLAEPLHQKYVRLGVLPSSEENSMAVGREGGPPDDEQARQVRDLAGMPSNKVEVAEGKSLLLYRPVWPTGSPTVDLRAHSAAFAQQLARAGCR